jgi:hypothetical protein
MGSRNDGLALRAVLRDPTFYLVCAAFTGYAFAFSAISLHLLPVFQAKGLTLAQAAWVGAMVGPMQVAGRVLELFVFSRIGALALGVAIMWVFAASLVMLELSGTLLTGALAIGALVVFTVFYGMANGILTIVRGAIPAQLYGVSHYGAVNGAMATPMLIGKAAGPIATTALLAWAGGYDAMVAMLAGLAMLFALLFTLGVWRAVRGKSSAREAQSRSAAGR